MGIGNVPLAVRLWTYKPGLVRTGDQYTDRHITAQLRDLSFRSSVPGGFQSASFALDRSLSDPGVDLAPFNGVAVYDTRSAEVVWEGVVEDVGKGVGSDGETWHVSAAGSASHAGDQTKPLIYVDRRLDAWENVNASVSGWTAQTELRETDDEPSIVFRWPRGTGLPAGNVSVSTMYRPILDAAQNLAIFGGTFDCGRTDATGDFLFQGIIRDGPGAWLAVESRNWTQTESAFVATRTTDWTGDYDQIRLRAVYTGAAVGTVGTDVEWVRVLGVYVRGTVFNADGTEDLGPYGHSYVTGTQVVSDLLGRTLARYDGVNADIHQTSFNINQLIYPDAATATQILDDMILFHPNCFWAAWETNPRTGRYRFEWSLWPSEVGFEADVSDGFDSQTGGVELYNKVLVRYKDVMGRTKTVTRTQTVPDLDRAGITRSPQPLDVADELGEQAAAIQIGDSFLAEHATAPNSGTLTVARPILDLTTGRKVDPWQLPLRAPGKLIRVRGITPRADALNATAKDAVTVFKVTGAEYTASSNTCTLELDSQPRTVAQLLARMEQRRLRKR